MADNMKSVSEHPSQDIELSIVLPCLNEAETLKFCIEEAKSFLDRSGVNGEVIIGDNGSTDGSQDIARQCGARVVDIPVRGYGAAVTGGFEAAYGKYLLMGDSDASYDLGNLQPFLDKLRSGSEVVMGNRFINNGIQPGAMPFKNRYLGNPVLTGVGKILFNCPFGDFHCGIRAISKDAFNRLHLQTTGMEFASEMIIKATINKLVISEVPVILRPDGRSRPPHLRPWRDGWRHLRFMLLFSPRWLFLYPGLLLGISGLVALIAIYRAPVTVGNITFDVNSMVFAAVAVTLGFQAVAFSIFAKTFATRLGVMPKSKLLEKFSNTISLETGLIAGTLLVLAGVLGAAIAVSKWRDVSFGQLNPRESLRLVVLSMTALLLGSQTILSSFLLGVMKIPSFKPR